jgi:hypothetical protein
MLELLDVRDMSVHGILLAAAAWMAAAVISRTCPRHYAPARQRLSTSQIVAATIELRVVLPFRCARKNAAATRPHLGCLREEWGSRTRQMVLGTGVEPAWP